MLSSALLRPPRFLSLHCFLFTSPPLRHCTPTRLYTATEPDARGGEMTQLLLCSTSSSDTHHTMPPPPPPPLALFSSSGFSRLLSAIFARAASNPLPIAYILYFSPYIARAAAFLLPLILTTAILLIAILPAISPAFTSHPDDDDDSPAVDDPDAVAYSGLLGVIWWELQACVDFTIEADSREETDKKKINDTDDSLLHRQRRQEQDQDDAGEKQSTESPANQERGGNQEGQQKAPSPSPTVLVTNPSRVGVITWQEFEAIGKLYKALTEDMDGLPLKLPTTMRKPPAALLPHSADQSQPPLAKEYASHHHLTPLPRCHSRASPLEGWETPGSEIDGRDDGQDDNDAMFSSATTQGLLLPWRSESMKGPIPQRMGPAAAWGRLGGSMREGQWRRQSILASKSMSVNHDRQWARSLSAAGVDEEGMDMLWEEYDEDKGKAACSHFAARKERSKVGDGRGDGKTAKKEKKNNRLTKMTRWASKAERREDVKEKFRENGIEDDDDAAAADDDEVEPGGGKLCCLQALRFSTGRMRFGMGKLGTGFARASRALKGSTLGALRHGSSSSSAARADGNITGAGAGKGSHPTAGP